MAPGGLQKAAAGPQTLVIYEDFWVWEANNIVKHEEIGPAGPQTLVIYEVFVMGMSKNTVKHEEKPKMAPKWGLTRPKNTCKTLYFAFYTYFTRVWAMWPDRGPAEGG